MLVGSRHTGAAGCRLHDGCDGCISSLPKRTPASGCMLIKGHRRPPKAPGPTAAGSMGGGLEIEASEGSPNVMRDDLHGQLFNPLGGKHQ